jgi:hypothetical protein
MINVLTCEANNDNEMVKDTGSRANPGFGKLTRTAVDSDMDAVSVYVM